MKHSALIYKGAASAAIEVHRDLEELEKFGIFSINPALSESKGRIHVDGSFNFDALPGPLMEKDKGEDSYFRYEYSKVFRGYVFFTLSVQKRLPADNEASNLTKEMVV